MTIKAVVFDLGGVLETNIDADMYVKWEACLNLKPGEVRERLLNTGWLVDATFGKFTEEEMLQKLGEIYAMKGYVMLESSVTQLTLAPDTPIDLQMHTIYSDGTWTPEQLIDYLASEGFGLAAITDHDRVDTATSLQRFATEKRFPLLVAVEMSASWRGEPTDVLCYGFDPARSAELNDLAQDIARRQSENTREVCENLRRKGYTVPNALELNDLLAQPSAQQPHALVALLKKYGYGTGKPSAGELITGAGFDWAMIDIAAVVDATHRGGGVCLIAHPGRGEGYTRYDASLLDQLRQEVPIDGFEVYHPAHTQEQIAMYLEYARKHSLLTSSGSDSHGPEKKPIKYRVELSRNLLEHLGIEIK